MIDDEEGGNVTVRRSHRFEQRRIVVKSKVSTKPNDGGGAGHYSSFEGTLLVDRQRGDGRTRTRYFQALSKVLLYGIMRNGHHFSRTRGGAFSQNCREVTTKYASNQNERVMRNGVATSTIHAQRATHLCVEGN
jgi:hypothetical protein